MDKLSLLPLLLLLGGCSFILVFPSHEDDDSAGGAGAGGSGGAEGGNGGGGGAPPMICEAFAPDPSFDKVVLQGAMENLDNTSVATTGLARDGVNHVLYALGQTTGGLAGHFPATHQYARDLYLLAVPDVGDPLLAMSAQSCDELNEAASGRMTLFGDGRQVIGGALGFDFENPANWSLDLEGNVCATTPTTIPGTDSWDVLAHPFFALVSDAGVAPSFGGGMGTLASSDGIGLDVDDNPPNLGAIGVVVGAAFDAPDVSGIEPKFFVQRSTESTADETFVLDDHVKAANTRLVEGAVAVDDDGTVWFGGGSCEEQFPCSDQGAFVGTLGKVGGPTMLAERPGVSSGVTAMDIADHVVVMGGRYTGALEMLGASLPEATGNDAFVLALDSTTQDLLWTYPDGDNEPGYELLGHDTVIDLAVLGERDCGAVYVLGCSVPSTTANADCVLAEVGKSAFVVKLDLATGARVWIQEIELENPDFDFFVPTALTAADDKLWVAGTLLGSVNVAGGTVSGDAPQESVIVQLSR